MVEPRDEPRRGDHISPEAARDEVQRLLDQRLPDMLRDLGINPNTAEVTTLTPLDHTPEE